jgi:K+/H+ antiporter YhaU regulatory subunit KhtT
MPDKNFFLKKSLLLVPMALLASLAVYQYRVINKGEKDLASIASQLNKEKDVTSNFEMVKNNLLLSGEKVTMLENTTLDLNKKLSEFKSTNQELYQLNESILKHAEQVLSAQRENNRISAKILDENSQLLKRLEK